MDVASITAREGALEPRRNILAAKFALQAAPRSPRSHALVGLSFLPLTKLLWPATRQSIIAELDGRTDRRTGALLLIHQKRSRDPSRAEMARAISTY